MVPKRDLKRTKIEDKFRHRKRSSSRPSWGRLGAILGHFRSPLGVIFVDFSLVFKAFRENSLFSKNVASRAILDRSWADFGPTWAAKWVRNGTPNGPKFDEKNMLKLNDILKTKKSPKRNPPRVPRNPTCPSKNGKRATYV